MKKTILIILMLILIPIVTAIYGGETWTYNFPECNTLRVNITAIDTIDDGEYIILNNCTKNGTNYYICDCTDDYYFNVTFNITGVNNYTFSFNYDYERYVEEQTSGGGGGGGGGGDGYSSGTKVCTPYWKCTEWSECKSNSRATRECNDLNKCNATKPSETRNCYYYVAGDEEEIVEEVVEDIEVVEDVKEVITNLDDSYGGEEAGLSSFTIFFLIIELVIIVGVILRIITKKRMKKQEEKPSEKTEVKEENKNEYYRN